MGGPDEQPRRADPGGEASSSPFRPAPRGSLLARTIPLSTELRGYRPPAARRDLLAGATVAALALPSAMAYAELAGLSPVAGLYALLLPTLAYALLGSSKRLIVGPEGSISALVAATVLGVAVAGTEQAAEVAATLALLVAACYGLALVLRLGWVADYFSRPVLIGYIHGVSIVLIVGQIPKLLGLDIEAADPIPQLVEIARELGDVVPATAIVGFIALAILLPARFLAPRFPAPLLVVVGGILASGALDLAGYGVAVVGEIPSGLPTPSLPTPGFELVATLMPAAFGIFLVSFADEILTARAYARSPHERICNKAELRAMCGAQAAAGLTQAFPIGASGSRTAVNDAMDARSQVSALAAALVVVLILFFLTGPVAELPKTVLAAAIIAAAVGLIDPAAWRSIATIDRVEVTIAAVTVGGVIVLGVLQAVTLAVALSILDVVRRSAMPRDAVLGWVEDLGRWADIADYPDARLTPGVVVYRLEDRLFFANAAYMSRRVREAVRGAPQPVRWVVLDAGAMSHIDSTGLEALGELATRLEAQGVTLVVAHMLSAVRGELEDTELAERIGLEHFHPTVRGAVAACVQADEPPA